MSEGLFQRFIFPSFLWTGRGPGFVSFDLEERRRTMAGRELAGAQEGKVGFLIRSSWAAFRSFTKVHTVAQLSAYYKVHDPLN